MSNAQTLNFREISDALDRSGGCRIVQDQAALTSQITTLYNDESIQTGMGMAGQKVSAAARGASERNMDRIRDLLNSLQG